MSDIHAKKVLILDFGSQYTQLIARRVREARVYCELHTSKMSEEAARAFAPSGIILSGGPDTVTLDETLRAPAWVFEMGCPVLGICYGLQTMAKQLGGKVESSAHREFGYASVEIVDEGGIFKDLADEIIDSKSTLDVWMSHGDKVTQIPPGFKILAKTASAPVAAMADEAKGYYGIQFHPEVTHTRSGMGIFQNFLHKICKIESQWTPSNIIEDCIAHVREQVGKEEVLLWLSGGVDSSVVAALLHKAIGSQLTCVFVDNGLLRLNEAKEVMDTFAEYGKVKVIHVDASERFLSALAGVSDPEAKRKVIGKVFIDVFEEEAAKIKNMAWLAQGTIYPDVIESAGSSGHAKVIKSHHNVGGLPDYMKLKLLEPIKELFKDEVRKIGIELGLPFDRVYRHPFPGPGLGVRILGEVKVEYTTILKQADAIFMEVLRKYDLYNSVNQAFAVFLPVKSVGVMGDERKYDYVIALRAVETTDFMTARWAHLPYAVLEEASNRIINEVKGISRVTYDISGKPPATIEWE